MSLQWFYSATATNSKLDYYALSNSLNLFSREMSGLQFIMEKFADRQSVEFVCECWSLKD